MLQALLLGERERVTFLKVRYFIIRCGFFSFFKERISYLGVPLLHVYFCVCFTGVYMEADVYFFGHYKPFWMYECKFV